MQPYPRLVRAEHPLKRRSGKTTQPFSNFRVKLLTDIQNLFVYITTKPRSGMRERDGLQGPKGTAVSLLPCVPEFIVLCISLQKRSQFVHMMNNPVAV